MEAKKLAIRKIVGAWNAPWSLNQKGHYLQETFKIQNITGRKQT